MFGATHLKTENDINPSITQVSQCHNCYLNTDKWTSRKNPPCTLKALCTLLHSKEVNVFLKLAPVSCVVTDTDTHMRTRRTQLSLLLGFTVSGGYHRVLNFAPNSTCCLTKLAFMQTCYSLARQITDHLHIILLFFIIKPFYKIQK